MGMIGISNSNVKTYTLKNADGSVAGTLSITRASKKKVKKLQYNFKEISAQIMRATTSGTARQIMSRARSKTVLLRKMKKSGNYEEKEVEKAIAHAEQMEKIAKKRMKHLQQEEEMQGGIRQSEMEEVLEDGTDIQEKRDLEPDSEEIKELLQELQKDMQAVQEEFERISGLEECSENINENAEPADLELLKKKHRADELREIMEADMKYLKAVFEKMAKEKQEASSGVSLELSGMEMPVPVPAMEAPVVAEGGSIDTSV